MCNVIATIAVYLITEATSELMGAASQLMGAASQLMGATSELTGAVYLTILLTKIFTFVLLPAHIS
ncbi:hypothetical protein NPM_4288 [Nostoc sp. 'Peltigera membranacea cyanobiont' N6]|nr:hypothetical protein NPM_4288 [Nostoc sp. 'Peltigera membranacea cyanobiont' N6]